MTEPTDLVREGGCLCGAVRFRAAGRPGHVCYCYCKMCQRHTGAPVAAWATFPRRAVTWLGTARRVRPSSDIAGRGFCGACGSALTWEGKAEADLIDLAVGAFDDNAGLAPDFHLWEESRPPWFETTDGKKRHRRSSKESG
jgi:hypothetical protein